MERSRCDVTRFTHLVDETYALKVYARLGLISTKLSIVKDLIEIVIRTFIARLEQYENGSKQEQGTKNIRRPKGFFRHLSTSCYESLPALVHKSCQGFPIFIGPLIACTATRINKVTLTTFRPLRVHLPEPPKALKLRYAFLTLYSFTRQVTLLNNIVVTRVT